MRKMYGVLLVSALASGSLLADVKVPGLFSDHAVLQKSEATAVFGKADPGRTPGWHHRGQLEHEAGLGTA